MSALRVDGAVLSAARGTVVATETAIVPKCVASLLGLCPLATGDGFGKPATCSSAAGPAVAALADAEVSAVSALALAADAAATQACDMSGRMRCDGTTREGCGGGCPAAQAIIDVQPGREQGFIASAHRCGSV